MTIDKRHAYFLSESLRQDVTSEPSLPQKNFISIECNTVVVHDCDKYVMTSVAAAVLQCLRNPMCCTEIQLSHKKTCHASK